MQKCSVPDCEQPRNWMGLCGMHAQRMKKYGSTDEHIRPKRTCSVDGCTRPYWAKGFCDKHYERVRRKGTTNDPIRSPEERFWEKVDRRGPDDCWEWQAAKVRGYGAFGGAYKDEKGWHGEVAHRFAYELLIGQIPEGAHLHHTCENPGCVNPAHLEIKTPSAHFLLTWIQTLRSLGYVVIEPT